MQPHTEQYYIEQGKRFWQQQDIPCCIACYDAAIRLNPQSEARQLKQMVEDILNFYHKDRYNP